MKIVVRPWTLLHTRYCIAFTVYLEDTKEIDTLFCSNPFWILLYQIIEIRHLKTNKNRIFNSSNMTNFKIISHCTSILKFNPNYKTISLILFYRLIHTRLQQFKVDSEYPPHIWWNIITMWFSFNYLITINLLNFACCCLSLLLKHQMLLTNSGH